MKGETEMRLWKKHLSLDGQRNITATYTDEGAMMARMWPAPRGKTVKAGKPRFLLICDHDHSMEEDDRIELREKRYRTLWVGRFPKHCEAVIEEEEE